jgi:hypothetical protein
VVDRKTGGTTTIETDTSKDEHSAKIELKKNFFDSLKKLKVCIL